MIKAMVKACVYLLFLICAADLGFSQQAEIVASLDRVEGQVLVTLAATGQTTEGRNGLLLRGGDSVETRDRARVTIRFRDGSEVRLFPSTRFVIEGVEEAQGREREFKYELLMRVGSMWGKFVRQNQLAQVSTPTATIGIKGTVFRVNDRDQKAVVALTEGVVEVRNELSLVELNAGQLLTEFSPSDDLTRKVADIPNRLDLRSDSQALVFPGNQPQEVLVTLQVVNIRTGRQVGRAGPVYFRSDYGKIDYPAVTRLDERGFARARLIIHPPEPSDAYLEGNIYVWALVDEEQAYDVAEGRILFTFQLPGGPERIQIEADTGATRRTE